MNSLDIGFERYRPCRARAAGLVSHLPEQSQYNRRLGALVELISAVQQRLARLAGRARTPPRRGQPACGRQLRLLRAAKRRRWLARYGYACSQHRYIWGVRLVLLTDERGLPLGYTIVPANEHEYEPLADLLTGTAAEVVLADKAFWAAAAASGRRRRYPPAHPLRRGAPPPPAAVRARSSRPGS
jgi:hypothetical protein